MATSSVIGLKFFAFASKEVNLVNVNSKIKLFRRTCGARNKICSKHVKSHHLLLNTIRKACFGFKNGAVRL